MNNKRLVSWVILLSGLMMACLMAAPFPLPAEGPVPFRRDRLPLDTDGIFQLSGALREIAEATKAESAAERRALAQMLAVSIALAPEDERAKKLLVEKPKRKFRASGDREKAEKQRATVWQSVEWLETPDAGIDGQALAACLKDVMVVADPQHPRSDALRGTGEQAGWSGWVPVLAEYEERRAEPSKEQEKSREEKEKSEEKLQEGPPRIRLAEASVPALLWKNEAKGLPPKWRLMPQMLTMKAEIQPRPKWEIEQGIQRKTISIGSRPESELLRSMESRVEKMLRNKFGSLPKDMVLNIRHAELDQSIESGNRHALSGVCGALAYAAISGIEPGALIIGQMEEDGRFLLTTDFWGQFQPLVDMTGLRLVVPAEGEEILMAFLGLEKPDFFFNNEVLMAKDIDEVVSLAAKKPEASLAGILGRFKEIRDKKGAQDVRSYIVNSFIRQRLQAIHKEEPRHLSSKALVIQALGKRPTTVPRPVLASELKQAVDMLGWVRATEFFTPKTDKPLVSAYQVCRAHVDRMTRYAKKEDQDLVDKALETAFGVRDLERASRGRGDYLQVEAGINSKKRSFDRAYDQFNKLAGAAFKR
jgi:hypothetical protein